MAGTGAFGGERFRASHRRVSPSVVPEVHSCLTFAGRKLIGMSMRRLAPLLACLLLLLPAAPAHAATSFTNPLNGSADPTLTFFNGSYYLATTLGDRIGIWRSPTLGGLASAGENTVWRDGDGSRNKQMWAPALYRFGGRWYVYYTASDGVDANHRNYVIESDGDDPLGPYHFKARIADSGEYAIDGEPFVHNGQMYFAWSGPAVAWAGPLRSTSSG